MHHFNVTELRCAPSTCTVHHWPALCTMVHKGDLFFVPRLNIVHYVALYWLGGAHDDFHVPYQLPPRWCTMWCCQSRCTYCAYGKAREKLVCLPKYAMSMCRANNKNCNWLRGTAYRPNTEAVVKLHYFQFRCKGSCQCTWQFNHGKANVFKLPASHKWQ